MAEVVRELVSRVAALEGALGAVQEGIAALLSPAGDQRAEQQTD